MSIVPYQSETIQVSPLVITHMEYLQEQQQIVLQENSQLRTERDEALDDNYQKDEIISQKDEIINRLIDFIGEKGLQIDEETLQATNAKEISATAIADHATSGSNPTSNTGKYPCSNGEAHRGVPTTDADTRGDYQDPRRADQELRTRQRVTEENDTQSGNRHQKSRTDDRDIQSTHHTSHPTGERENRITSTEEENYRLREEIRRLREQQERAGNLIDWLRKILKNSSIPAGCKVTYVSLYLIFFFMRDQIIGEEMQIGLIELAQETGQSTSSISSHLNRASTHELLTRRDEKLETSDGEPRTIVHLTLHDALAEPEHIDLKKEQGGARQKGCKKDGTPLDSYTVRHCPTHGEIELYKQAGQRKEANETLMIDDFIRWYQDRVPYALADMQHTSHEKQDAFDAPVPEQEIEIKISPERTTSSRLPKKQDAFDAPVQQLPVDQSETMNDQAAQKQDAFSTRKTAILLATLMGGYNVEYRDWMTCSCGSHLWWPQFGDHERPACAACEPGGLWPEKYLDALKMLYPRKLQAVR